MLFKKGVNVCCPNCGGHTRVVGEYGECDFCGSLLTNPITQTMTHKSIWPTKQESMGRFRERETIQEMENILREANHPMCVSDICQQMTEPFTTQKCLAYVRKLVDSGKVKRIEDRREVYFIAIEG